MLRRFISIGEELLQEHDSWERDIEIDDTARFQGKVIKYVTMLSTIDDVTKSLQSNYHTLSECRDDLDALMEAVNEGKHDPSSVLYPCRQGQKYIYPTADIVQYPHFEAGLVKIQKSIENQMNESEKAAISNWKKSINSSGTSSSRGASWSKNISEGLAKRRKRGEETRRYIDCNFILGSVAEVERVFIAPKYVLSENRRSMAPHRFEAIMILKLNSRF